MVKIPQETINSIKDFLDIGNSYSGTEEHLRDLVAEVLTDNKFAYPYADELEVVDYFGGEITEHMSLEHFVYESYDKIVDGFINVLETEE